ncbi:MAG: hypothetical protein P1Q69_07045 [Candidatus Thorarchaeota archaeon]|nr:hypothetical protein [Candidatus Thorarchaeota archaeon]
MIVWTKDINEVLWKLMVGAEQISDDLKYMAGTAQEVYDLAEKLGEADYLEIGVTGKIPPEVEQLIVSLKSYEDSIFGKHSLYKNLIDFDDFESAFNDFEDTIRGYFEQGGEPQIHYSSDREDSNTCLCGVPRSSGSSVSTMAEVSTVECKRCKQILRDLNLLNEEDTGGK